MVVVVQDEATHVLAYVSIQFFNELCTNERCMGVTWHNRTLFIGNQHHAQPLHTQCLCKMVRMEVSSNVVCSGLPQIEFEVDRHLQWNIHEHKTWIAHHPTAFMKLLGECPKGCRFPSPFATAWRPQFAWDCVCIESFSVPFVNTTQVHISLRMHKCVLLMFGSPNSCRLWVWTMDVKWAPKKLRICAICRQVFNTHGENQDFAGATWQRRRLSLFQTQLQWISRYVAVVVCGFQFIHSHRVSLTLLDFHFPSSCISEQQRSLETLPGRVGTMRTSLIPKKVPLFRRGGVYKHVLQQWERANHLHHPWSSWRANMFNPTTSKFSNSPKGRRLCISRLSTKLVTTFQVWNANVRIKNTTHALQMRFAKSSWTLLWKPSVMWRWPHWNKL